MTRNLLEEIYGRGYEPPGPGGDPNSLGYVLHGPAAPVDTTNILNAMSSQQAAKEREPYEALVRLFMTAAAPWASAPL